MTPNDPLVTSAESVRIWRQQRFNPIRSATPASLARALEAFEIGDLREGALLFESIAERDDTLMSVKPKREKEVSQLDKQVMAIPGSGAEGEAHKEVLEDFWNNVTAINAYDRNVKGKFRRLVKQMMTSVSFRYAAHHIVWQVKNGKLRATFEFVPLWLFENRTGTLRYLKNPWATEGEILADGEWMVTAGDGLMIACSIGWSAKRNAFNDWLIFSAKFSVPGTLGRTSAAKDSPEGQAMHEAVRTFGHDWAGVIYGDDGTHAEPIKIIQASGNPSGMPMPAVVERVDRKIAAMYRGADLSTMSAGGGEGSGASLQEKEGDILLSDDAETICETLEEISKKVIEWHFGYDTEPLARLELIVPKREDTTNLVTDATALADRGARVSTAALMDRLSLQTASDDGEARRCRFPRAPLQGGTPRRRRAEPCSGCILVSCVFSFSVFSFSAFPVVCVFRHRRIPDGDGKWLLLRFRGFGFLRQLRIMRGLVVEDLDGLLPSDPEHGLRRDRFLADPLRRGGRGACRDFTRGLVFNGGVSVHDLVSCLLFLVS